MSGDLNAWIDAYDLPVTTVAPLDDSTMQELGIRETAFVVDLTTMEIVWRTNGSLAGLGESSGSQGVTALFGFLEQ